MLLKNILNKKNPSEQQYQVVLQALIEFSKNPIYDIPEFKKFLSNENPHILHIARELKLENLPNFLPQMVTLFNYKSEVASTQQLEINQLTKFINDQEKVSKQDHHTTGDKVEKLYPIENRALDFRPYNVLNQLLTGGYNNNMTEFEFADFISKINELYGDDIEVQRTMQGIIDFLYDKVTFFYKMQFGAYTFLICLPFILQLYL